MRLFRSRPKPSGSVAAPPIDPGPPYPGFDPQRHLELRQFVDAVRFDMTQTVGYEVADVDGLIDQLQVFLAGPHLSEGARAQMVEILSSPRLRRSSRIGYTLGQVDDFLAAVSAEVTPVSAS